ncbi:MAG: hypothetical protein ABIZ91_07815 [Gemmatimonadaceae bacterium]
MRQYMLFAVVGAIIITAAGGVLAMVYAGAPERQAIVISAVVAFVVQLVSFAILRLTAEKNVIAGWGLGAIIRMLVFVVYALVIVKALGLPASAAMISMAVFLFASTLVEPLFLKT